MKCIADSFKKDLDFDKSELDWSILTRDLTQVTATKKSDFNVVRTRLNSSPSNVKSVTTLKLNFSRIVHS